jgi:hypothetical protein
MRAAPPRRSPALFAALVPASLALAAAAQGCVLPAASILDNASGGSGGAATSSSASGGCPADTNLPAGQNPVLLVADTGASPRATGLAMQSHLLRTSDGFQLFYLQPGAPSTTIASRSSHDFATWKDGPSFDLPGVDLAGEAWTFGAAVRRIGMADVYHFSLSGQDPATQQPLHAHARGRFDIQTGKLDQTVVQPFAGPDPKLGVLIDCPVTDFLNDGRVVDLTGRALDKDGSPGDAVSRLSALDDGSAAAPAFADPVFHGKTNLDTMARALVPLSASGRALAIWTGAEAGGGKPGDLRSALFDGAHWSSTWTDVFAKVAPTDIDDWSYAARGDAVHVVRATMNGFAHRVFRDGAWTDEAAPATIERIEGSGLVLSTDGKGSLWLFTLAPGGAVKGIRWSDDCGWHTWYNAVAPDGGARAYLTGLHEVVALPGISGLWAPLAWSAAIQPPSGPLTHVIQGVAAPAAGVP